MKHIFFTLLFIFISNASYIQDNSSNTVLDTTRLIMWQNDNDAKNLKLTWKDAINYCENNVTLVGYSDWRMPNINELITIIDINRAGIAIDNSFNNISDNGFKYWSSTSYIDSLENAWLIHFQKGQIQTSIKTANNYIRCVRKFN
jgi:hypothetical protein